MRSALFTVQIILLLLAGTMLCGCDFIYHLLQKEGAQEKKLIGELVPSEANPVVLEAQKLLKIFGQNIGRADGKLGARTRTSIAKFQEQQKLKITRFLDKATWEELHQFDASGLVIKGDIDVAALQSALKQAGQYKGKVDGKLGPQTLKAVQDFQKKNKLKADGNAGYRTLQAIAKYTAAAPAVSEGKR